MRIFLGIITILILFCAGAPVHSEEKEDLFLVRIISIDESQHRMILEVIDGKQKNINETLIYNLESIPGSFKQGDIIRIWGVIDRQQGIDTQSSDTKHIENITKISVIRGKISGMSYRTGDDPTGVRKRLKRRINSHPPPSRGAGRG